MPRDSTRDSRTRGWWPRHTAHLARLGLERRHRYALRPTRATCLVWRIPTGTPSRIKPLRARGIDGLGLVLLTARRRAHPHDDPRHGRRKCDYARNEDDDAEHAQDVVDHGSRIAAWLGRASSCWTLSERANCRMRVSSVTRGRTPSGTSPAPSVASTCPRWRLSASGTSSRWRAV